MLDGFNPNRAETDGNGSLTTRYVNGDAFDQVFAHIDAGATRWLLTDHLLSVRAVIDNAGTVLDRIAYDAFGNVTYELNAAYGGHILFTSRQFDAETGFYFNRARYLNPETGTWTTQDPIGFAAGDPNLYRYVGNSPTNFIDPSGNIAWAAVLAGAGEAGITFLWGLPAIAAAGGVWRGAADPGWSWDMLVPFWGGGRLMGSGAAEIRNGNLLTGFVQLAAGTAYSSGTLVFIYGPAGLYGPVVVAGILLIA